MLYSFEDFSLDRARCELRGGGSSIALQPLDFDPLEYLIRQRERVVSKDDLLAAVWNGRIGSESTLSTRINAARSAIGDSGEEQRLIRTAHGKGIRFVGAVREEKETVRKLATAKPRVWTTAYGLVGALALNGDLDAAKAALAASFKLQSEVNSLAQSHVYLPWTSENSAPKFWMLLDKTLGGGPAPHRFPGKVRLSLRLVVPRFIRKGIQRHYRP